jgi:AAA-like domain
MNSDTELSWEKAKEVVDFCCFEHHGKHLTDLEIDVLRGTWDGKSYEEIAEQLFRSTSYINKDVGYRLWKKLSEALGEEVTKKSFRQALNRRWQKGLSPTSGMDVSNPQSIAEIELPDGFVPLNSRFYLERAQIEAECAREILKPGALIRIRAPQRTGKTSLLNRILARAETLGYRTVRLNLHKAEKNVFSDLDRFLRWFCANVSRQLNLEPRLNDYWDEEIGSKVSCTGYFQSYILEEIDTNIVIGLDEIDTVFSYPDIAEDFLALLREWHEEAALQESWQQLRLVIAHATEVYISLNIHQSPFNVGLPIKLPNFTIDQVAQIAQLHGLNWTATDARPLTAMVGGQPYLIRLALYHLARQQLTLPKLLQDAPTHAGIYSDYLRGCLERIKHQPELAMALKQIVAAEFSAHLEPVIAYQLDSMGAIQLDGNSAVPSCELYRQYFLTNL